MIHSLSVRAQSLRICCRRNVDIRRSSIRNGSPVVVDTIRIVHQSSVLEFPKQQDIEHQSSISYDRDSGIVSLFVNNSKDNDSNKCTTLLFQTIIGLEIHAQLDIATKLFSSAPTTTRRDANTLVNLFDIGYPGTLPILSKSAVEKAVLASAALNCQIHTMSRFERKHYTYADLPLGYQITQQRWPLASKGYLKCRHTVQQDKNAHTSFFTVGIHRIQIEQDTGKTIVTPNQQLIDLNRAGCSLIEIVFLPDIRSAHQAASAVLTLQQLLKHIGVCDGKMEEGSLRCDLNVSIAPIRDDKSNSTSNIRNNEFFASLPFNCGKRVEVKNLNSIRQIILATEYEVCRQAKSYYYKTLNKTHDNEQEGEEDEEETRTYDPASNQTIKIRSKKGAVDYRFLPEPDLPPLVIKDIDFILQKLPELPEQVIARFIDQYGLKEDVASVLVSNHPPLETIEFYEAAVKHCVEDLQHETNSPSKKDLRDVGPSVANWLCNDLFALLKESSSSNDNADVQSKDKPQYYSAISPMQLGSLVAMTLDETVSVRAGKNILSILFTNADITQNPRQLAEQRGWKLLKDSIQLRQICNDVLLNHQKQLRQYVDAARESKETGIPNKSMPKLEKFLLGKALAVSQGNAHPDLLLLELRKLLLDAESSSSKR